jgi:hypothetical protein
MNRVSPVLEPIPKMDFGFTPAPTTFVVNQRMTPSPAAGDLREFAAEFDERERVAALDTIYLPAIRSGLGSVKSAWPKIKAVMPLLRRYAMVPRADGHGLEEKVVVGITINEVLADIADAADAARWSQQLAAAKRRKDEHDELVAGAKESMARTKLAAQSATDGDVASLQAAADAAVARYTAAVRDIVAGNAYAQIRQNIVSKKQRDLRKIWDIEV